MNVKLTSTTAMRMRSALIRTDLLTALVYLATLGMEKYARVSTRNGINVGGKYENTFQFTKMNIGKLQ